MKTASVILVVLLAGCTVMPMKRAEIEHVMLLQADCRNADIQVRYLQAQRELNNQVATKENIESNRRYNAVVTHKIWQIRSECQ